MSSGEDFTKKVIGKFRSELLDLTKRNSLISFRHTNKSVKQIRIIDEVISKIYEKLLSDNEFSFSSISVQNNIPEDEKSEQFELKIKEIKLSNQEYAEKRANLGDEPSERDFLALDIWVRDFVRVELGLPPVKRGQSLPVGEHARNLGIDPSFDLISKSNKKKHTDNALQTLLYPDQLERRLKSIYEQCKLYESEAGINILYFSLGFLEWYEDNETKAVLAPLILVPVEIIRKEKKGGYIFEVKLRDNDDISHNLCLEENLKRNFGLKLPTFDPEDGEIDKYFQDVFEIIKSKPNWKIKQFATLGFFSFAKLAMYKDLDPANWNETTFSENSIAHALINKRPDPEERIMFAEDYDVDAKIPHTEVPLPITDADSSQLSAIIDVINGKDLVIEGPPGTGKSQTITNIIAAALEREMKVLFISEKKAALEVVKSRLDKAGLGDFCLELHSNKTKRAEIAKAMSDSVKLRSKKLAKIDIQEEINKIESIKRNIRNYIDTIHEVYHPLEVPYQNIIWNLLGLSSKIVDESKINGVQVSDYKNINKHKLQNIQSEIRNFNLYRQECKIQNNLKEYLWAPFLNGSLDTKNYSMLLNDISIVSKSVNDFIKIQDHSSLHIVEKINFEFSEKAKFFLEFAPSANSNKILISVLKNLDNKEFLETIIKYVSLHQKEIELLGELNTVTNADIIDYASIGSTNLPEQDKLGPLAHISSKEISSNIEKLNARKDSLSSNMQILGEAIDSLDLKKPITLRDYKDLYSFSSQIVNIPSFVFQYRNKNVCRPEAPNILKDLKDKTVEVLNLQNSLRNSFRESALQLSKLDTSTILTQFRNKHFFSFLNSEYRKAKKLFNSHYSGDKYSFRFAIAILETLDTYLVKTEHLHQSYELSFILPGAKTCFEVPFEKIEQTIELVGSFKAEFPETRDFSRSLQEIITSEDNEKLDKAKRILGSKLVIEAISGILSELELTSKDKPEYCLNFLSTNVDKLSCFLPFETMSFKAPVNLRQLYDFKSKTEAKRYVSGEKISICNKFPDFTDLTDFASLRITLNFHKAISSLDSSLKTSITTSTKIADFYSDLEKAVLHIDTLDSSLEYLRQKWNVSVYEILGTQYRFAEIKEIQLRIQDLENNKNLLLPSVQFKESEQALQGMGLGAVLKAISLNRLNFENLEVIFNFCLYNTILNDFFSRNHDLKKNISIPFAELRKSFREQDKNLIELQRKKIKQELTKLPIVPGCSTGRVREFTEMGFINHQIGLQKNHAPIRDYFTRSRYSILSLKPCLMMSPLSISQYLPNNDICFDLVVMDEASQLKPEDALGAILRAKQVVIVGDPKQLPPTSFFNFGSDAQSDDDDEDYDGLLDNESILDLAISSFKPARRLKWHYRSKHESLITPSNNLFYDKDLVIFPSPSFEDEELGLKYLYVEEGVYQGRKNLPEAQAVIKYLCEHIEKYPNKSIGIVTTNQPQQALIKDLLDMEMNENILLQSFLKKHEDSLEPLIIKNLENIQGDERDVILISTVYGRESGASKFKQAFGPINGKMGHRRLNVLFTRARYKTVTITSLDPDLIVVNPGTSSRGLVAFKDFLTFAKYKNFGNPVSTGTPDSEFEVFVMNALTSRGFEVQCQVGVFGYRIDLAIVHPSLPGKYLLGIECDGATYHSSKAAKDRDKIRQEILESLGWKIYRIWSTDWFNDPKKETEKLLNEIKKLVA